MVLTHEIVDGVEAKLSIHAVLEKTKYTLFYSMVGVVCLTILISYGSVALVLETIARNNPNWNTWQRFDTSNNAFRRPSTAIHVQDMVSQNIPFAQRWFQDDVRTTTTSSLQNDDSALLVKVPWDRPTTNSVTKHQEGPFEQEGEVSESTCLVNFLSLVQAVLVQEPDPECRYIGRNLFHFATGSMECPSKTTAAAAVLYQTVQLPPNHGPTRFPSLWKNVSNHDS